MRPVFGVHINASDYFLVGCMLCKTFQKKTSSIAKKNQTGGKDGVTRKKSALGVLRKHKDWTFIEKEKDGPTF